MIETKSKIFETFYVVMSMVKSVDTWGGSRIGDGKKDPPSGTK